jgi:hypothetical protein
MEVKLMQRDLLCIQISLFLLLTAAAGQNVSPSDAPPSIGFSVLYNFTGGADGCCLYGGLARDGAGNLYGVAYINESGSGDGDLFKLVSVGSGYQLKVLHNFTSVDGLCITTPVLDEEGNLFGVCTDIPEANGTLWEYSHSGRFLVLHTFNGASDGSEPQDAVALDSAGNIFGTTYISGPGGSGTVWEYSRSLGTFSVLHAFANGNDGGNLIAGPRLDGTGKLWGTTEYGPNCYFCGRGTVWNYDLVSGTFTTVLDFGNSGVNAPQSHFAFDTVGNLFGTAFGLTVGNCGLVYELDKSRNYAPVVLYSFTGNNGDGCYPYGNLAFDPSGSLLGTTYNGGTFGYGAVYKLTHENGAWHESIVHSFDLSDGYRPQSGLNTDAASNVFGTASAGGNYGEGVIFELTGVH